VAAGTRATMVRSKRVLAMKRFEADGRRVVAMPRLARKIPRGARVHLEFFSESMIRGHLPREWAENIHHAAHEEQEKVSEPEEKAILLSRSSLQEFEELHRTKASTR